MIKNIDPSWRRIIENAFKEFDDEYLRFLQTDTNYFPNRQNFLNAFKTLSLQNTKYILFGQDPYPRKESAIGYAFIDAKVDNIFCENGLSKEVNRATSLRNFIKMLLLCEGKLKNDFSKNALLKIDTSKYIRNIHQLRENFEKNGVLLLNTALVFTSKKESKKHIKEWRGFVSKLLDELKDEKIELILFGKIAREIEKLDAGKNFKKRFLPHPYNLSFITEEEVHKLFAPMKLLYPSPLS